jgi:hypothetical protein
MRQTHCSSCGAIVRAESRFCRMCGIPFRGGESSATIQEIAFDDVKAADRILIQTENSQYRFCVVDPQSRRGKLSGGSFGDGLQDATLVGVLVGGRGGEPSDTSRLKIDSCALFYVNVGAGLKRLTTSIITSLTHIKNDKSQSNRLRWSNRDRGEEKC